MIIGLNASGWAQDLDASRAEYLSNCAACHGSDGKGNGPLSSKLRAKPADLTTFAKRNNGVFPLSAVYEVIDGTGEAARRAASASVRSRRPFSILSGTATSRLARSRDYGNKDTVGVIRRAQIRSALRIFGLCCGLCGACIFSCVLGNSLRKKMTPMGCSHDTGRIAGRDSGI